MGFKRPTQEKYCKCRRCSYYWKYIECDENTITCPACGEVEYKNTMSNYMEWNKYIHKESEVNEKCD